MRFSIIVPVYNVEKYIKECINSLLFQIYTDYEIILVDDGSTDKSKEICDEYKNQNSDKINVIHKINGGLSDARNAGIKVATGDYLIFIDSDDYICDNYFLEKISKIIIEEDSELLVFGNKKYYEKNNQYEEKPILNYNHNEKINIETLISANYFKACAWDKVIKKDILIDNKLYFPLGRLSEDIEWCAKVLKSIKLDKISILNENVYVYRQRENSISTKVNEKFIKDIYEMIEGEIIKEETDIARVINSYLAYEYSVLLGWTSIKKISLELKKKIFELRYILNYDISNKVKLINKLISLIRNKLDKPYTRKIYKDEK